MKMPLRPFAVLPAIALLSACGQSAQTLADEARASFTAHDFVNARVQAAKSLERKPANRAMLVLLMEAQLRLGDPDGAQTSLERLRSAGARGAEVRRLAADLALLKGDAKGALGLVGADPAIDAWRVRASARMALGDVGGALAAYRHGMAQGDDLQLEAAYGQTLLQGQRVGEAQDVLSRMRSAFPGAYETRMLAAGLDAARGEVDRAIARYRAVMAAFPAELDPLIALADQYDRKGAFDEENAIVTRASKMAPADSHVQALQMRMLYRAGQWEKLRLAMQDRDGDLDPASDVALAYAQALLRTGHAEQARGLMLRGNLRAPYNRYVSGLLGMAQMKTGDVEAAWKTLAPLSASPLADEQVLRAAADAAQTLGLPQADTLHARLDPARLKASMMQIQRAGEAMNRRDWGTALAIYTRLASSAAATGANPDDPLLLQRMALACDGMGRHADALAFANRALAADPGDPRLSYLAGAMRLRAGVDAAQSVRLIGKAVAADPGNPVYAQALVRAQARAGDGARSGDGADANDGSRSGGGSPTGDAGTQSVEADGAD